MPSLSSKLTVTPGLVLGSGIVVPVPAEPAGGALLRQLARTLDARGIAYCQWKGHWSSPRWASGLGQVDLLVDRDRLPELRLVLGELGFKPAIPSAARHIVGIETYIGHDPEVQRLLHLRVYYHLLLGSFWKPIYRIPIERQLVDSAVPGELFRVPNSTHQFVVFVLRMMLTQVGRPLLSVRRRWLAGIYAPLASLEAGCEWQQLTTLFAQHLPFLDPSLFERCVRSLQGHVGWLERAILPWLLARRLRPHGRRLMLGAVLSALMEKLAAEPVARSIGPGRLRLSGGGVVVALVDDDGTGRSTCTRELWNWLDPVFPVLRAQFGTPPRSLFTCFVDLGLSLRHAITRGVNRESPSDGALALIRHVCLARDRYRLYTKIRRFAVSGGIALCEHYPIPLDRPLVGPSLPSLLGRTPGVFGRVLRKLEASYYKRMVAPDVVCLLRSEADPAMQPKPAVVDSERSSTKIYLVDASQTLPTVLLRLKSVLWQIL